MTNRFVVVDAHLWLLLAMPASASGAMYEQHQDKGAASRSEALLSLTFPISHPRGSCAAHFLMPCEVWRARTARLCFDLAAAFHYNESLALKSCPFVV